MRRITIFLVFLGLVSVSVDAEILYTFTTMTERARNDLGIDASNTTYLSDTTAHDRIREGMRMVNSLLRYNRTDSIVVTAVKTYKYRLRTNNAGVTSVQWIRDDTIKTLLPIPKGQWGAQEHQHTKEKSGMLKRPSYYDFYDDTLYLYPIPTRIDSIYVTTWDRIESGDSTVSSLPVDTASTLAAIKEIYRPAVLKYIIYETAKANQHPLTAIYRQDYEEMMMILFPNFKPQAPSAQ